MYAMITSAVLFLTLSTAVRAMTWSAVAVLRGESGIMGNVTFTQGDGGKTVLVTGTVMGLAHGMHGFHIHEKGDLTNGCTSAGGHFNPEKMNHGGPDDRERHVGDLGNIAADEAGVAHIHIEDSMISLHGGHSILGRAVVVHSDKDDLGKGGFSDSLTTGHAGSRVACGVIGIQNPVIGWSSSGAVITTSAFSVMFLSATALLLARI